MTPKKPLLSTDSREMLVKRRLRLDEERYPVDLNSARYARMSGDSGTLLEYWRILNRRKGTLFLCALFSTLFGFLLTRVQSPVYRARTLIEIESLNEDFLNLRSVTPTAPDGNGQTPEYNIRTQIAVLQSRPVLERTLQKNNLEKRLLAKKPRRKLPWSQGQSSPARGPALLHDDALSIVRDALRVRPQPSTRVLEVTSDSTDPQIAADLANALTSAFAEVSLENRWRSIQNTSEWLTRQLQDVKTKLEKSQDELQRYARASNLTFLSSLSGGDTTSEERLKQLQVELSKAEADRVETQSRYEQATKAPADSLPEVVDNPTLRDYQVQLTTLRRQLADLSSSYTSNYPKVVSVRSQIAALETALEKERANVIVRTRNQYESALRREKLVNRDYAGVINLLSQQADKVNHYSLLKREVDTTRQLYDSMVQRVKEADLASAMKATDIHVIESAVAPDKPYKPIALLNMGFGLLSGLCFGVVVVVQRARSNSGIEEPGETVLELNVPELGVIPAAIREKSYRFRRLPESSVSAIDQDRPELTTNRKSVFVLAESFRLTLASILLSSNDGVRPRVIAFSSASAGEGKTTLTSNLGIALARMDRRVLLIDGDLRRPRLHRIFEVDNSVGLYQAFAGGVPSVKETKIQNLFVLPSGSGTNGDTLFFTSQLHDLLQRLRTDFDTILIDTPPLLQVADARLICSQADGTVLVVAQHTPREVAVLARQNLADDGSPVLGTILNKWDPKSSLRGYPSYHTYGKSYYADNCQPPSR